MFLGARTARAQVIMIVTSARARRGRLSARSVFLYKSVLYGAFVLARRVLNGQKRRFPARADDRRRDGEGDRASRGDERELGGARDRRGRRGADRHVKVKVHV